VRRRVPCLIAAGVAVLVLVLAGCQAMDDAGSPAGDPGRSAALRVVATTTQVADFARNVGGDRVQVTQLLKPNVDPHDYEASPADVQAIATADLVVKNGVGLEKFLDDAVSSAGFTGTVVDTSAGVKIRAGDEQEPGGDPHIWQDPTNAKIMVHNIATAFEASDPAGTAEYRANETGYTAKIDALDARIQTEISGLPVDQRKLVTNHDAFGYYIARYHLQFLGSILPTDTSAELSGKDIADLVTKIKAAEVKAIFAESSLPPKTAEAIGREAGVTVIEGEDALYGDTLGPPGSAGATYLQMEQHNTDTIVRALRG
jgi:zinc/manganese transport system substrate-binding protein/manganese/iron transport system substrate-binding protein